ncbi:MAG: sulfatase/phosphatase domain-containing protein, partial [Planctomycetota bacterium]
PLILHWPKGIPASRHGTLYHDPSHLIDIMATCVDLAGATYPETFKGKAIHPMEGVSLRPAFTGKSLTARPRPIFWEHEGNKAVRLGKWKLVAVRGGPWELYDMEADRTELHDLADKMPAKVEELKTLWEAWAKRANVLPWGSWRKGRRRRKGGTSKETSFKLKQGDELQRHEAPMVANRPFTVTATIQPTRRDGVIVGHGGHRCGWAVHLKDGRLVLTTSRDHAKSVVTSKDQLPAGKITITVKLAKDGAVAFTANGTSLATEGKLPGPVHDMPDEPLTVGRDVRSPIGDYPEENNAFSGTIETVRIQLGK